MGRDRKLCHTCKTEQPLEAFNRDNARPDRRRSRCRECDAKHFKNKYDNPEWRQHQSNRTKARRARIKDVDPTRLWASDALANAKMRAKRTGLPCSITMLDIMDAVVDTCPLLGLPLVYTSGKVHNCSPTIDRKVCERGYVKDNIAVISHRANRIKSDSTIEELQTLLSNLINYMNSD